VFGLGKAGEQVQAAASRRFLEVWSFIAIRRGYDPRVECFLMQVPLRLETSKLVYKHQSTARDTPFIGEIRFTTVKGRFNEHLAGWMDLAPSLTTPLHHLVRSTSLDRDTMPSKSFSGLESGYQLRLM